MNKTFTYFIFIIVLHSVANAEDFRSATWGMSKEQVTMLEKDHSTQTIVMPDGSNLLEVQDSIVGVPAMVTYMFIENKLVQGTTAFFKLGLDGTVNNAQANLLRILDGLERSMVGQNQSVHLQ